MKRPLKVRLHLFWLNVSLFLITALMKSLQILAPAFFLVFIPLWMTDCPAATGDWEECKRLMRGEPLREKHE